MSEEHAADLLYRFRGSYRKKDGWVCLTSRGVSWSGSGGESVSMVFSAMGKYEVSPEGHPKSMLKLTPSTGGKAVVLTVLEASQERAYATLCDAKITITHCMRRCKASAGTAKGGAKRKRRAGQSEASEGARRARLLEGDAALAAQHRDLVGGGVVTEEDFWSARGRAVPECRGDALAPSNELLVDAPASTANGGRPKVVNFSLSPEKIAFVFAMSLAASLLSSRLVSSRLVSRQERREAREGSDD